MIIFSFVFINLLLIASLIANVVLNRKRANLWQALQKTVSQRDSYHTEVERSLKIIENMDSRYATEVNQLRQRLSSTKGDLTPEQEAELITRLDDVIAENDALLDQVDSLKSKS